MVHYEAFHITATMASKVFNSGDKLDLLQALLKSWFNHSRSTEPMAIGAKNEDAMLMSLAQKPFVSKIYNVGLLESNKIPRLAASPEAVVVIKDMVPGITQVAVVEVKTRVSLEKIAKAERIAMKYNHQVIQYNFGDEVWFECVGKDHSNQIMCQILVTGFKYCMYIVAEPGTAGAKGKAIYTSVFIQISK